MGEAGKSQLMKGLAGDDGEALRGLNGECDRMELSKESVEALCREGWRGVRLESGK